MFYRIILDLAYSSDTNPKSIMAHAKTLFKDAQTINPGQPTQEVGFIQLQKCYHDENPFKPCEVIESIYTPT